ncbi:unnamed protein product [Callosobruchus maculatus]|uniref:Uncharacterized protein n=1 Tax=Callosobruchus maculatus TaxID=64391 RepID=A0A653CVX0_CALMS|nr:unnamed protein product [Callosobruchus maculatus]
MLTTSCNTSTVSTFCYYDFFLGLRFSHFPSSSMYRGKLNQLRNVNQLRNSYSRIRLSTHSWILLIYCYLMLSWNPLVSWPLLIHRQSSWQDRHVI